MAAYPGETHPTLAHQQLGDTVASLAVLAGEALQHGNTDVLAQLSFISRRGSISVELDPQQLALEAFDSAGLAARYSFASKGFNGMVQCNVEDHSMTNSLAQYRQRLATNNTGHLVLIRERRNADGHYEPLDEEPASTEAFLSMAAWTRQQASPIEESDAEEGETLLGSNRGVNELTVAHKGIIPVLGKLLVMAGNAVRDVPGGTIVHVDTQINGGSSRLYTDNSMQMWATNRTNGTDATFRVHAHPFAGIQQGYAFVRAVLRTNINKPSGTTTTTDKLIQSGNEVKRVRHRSLRGTSLGSPETLSATVSTIQDMAGFITKLAQGETTDYEE